MLTSLLILSVNDVTEKNVILEQEFLDKIEDMLDEAEDNPDYQA